MISTLTKPTPWGIKNSPLVDFAAAIRPVEDEMIQIVNEASYPMKVKKGAYILQPGDICANIYLINKGMLRAFMLEEKKELTTWMIGENEIATSIRGLSKAEPSLEYIQALEDCDLTVLSYEVLHDLYEHFPVMNTIGRLILEQYYMEAEERAYICRIPSAEKKYKHFLETRSELINRVPLKYIASFLGMTVETISRIRAKRSI